MHENELLLLALMVAGAGLNVLALILDVLDLEDSRLEI
jgi:hypothetical protein